jgi:YjjG family noncanonical pyrimidine nucleotidase
MKMTNSKRYTHLFFDLDNTLWDFTSNSYDALFIALDKLGLIELVGPYDQFFKIYSEVNEKLWDQYRKGLIHKKVLSIQRFEETFIAIGIPLEIGGGILNDVYLNEMPLQTKLIDGARELLDYLHGRYEIAIITNGFKEVQYDKIRKSELSKYFRKIFISEEVGAQKPGRQIFEYAIKSMNAPKKSSLMIGDSWDADIVGAMNFGIDQVYFSPNIDEMDNLSTFQSLIQINATIIQKDPKIHCLYPLKIQNNRTATSLISHLEQVSQVLNVI